MHDYQTAFIDLALRSQALKFGEFTLKSGRVSPYFFNAGAFQTGADLAQLGQCYAEALLRSNIAFDMLLGPAYKGIPLVSACACVLAQTHNLDVPYTFNRKEAKQHGEGGTMVGAPLQGKVAIVDDVITAGTAIREVLKLFEGTDAQPALIAIGLDRNEVGQDSQRSAVQELESLTSVSVINIVQLSDIIGYLAQNDGAEGLHDYSASQLKHYREQIQRYRDRYGAKD